MATKTRFRKGFHKCGPIYFLCKKPNSLFCLKFLGVLFGDQMWATRFMLTIKWAKCRLFQSILKKSLLCWVDELWKDQTNRNRSEFTPNFPKFLNALQLQIWNKLHWWTKIIQISGQFQIKSWFKQLKIFAKMTHLLGFKRNFWNFWQ